jgi:hypothetical protein
MRTAPALVLVALLALSGCAGLFAGTSSPSPTDTSAEPPAETVPGVTDGRLTDASALLGAHAEALTATGYETRIEVNATERLRGDRYEASRLQQTIVEPGSGEYLFRLTDRAAGARFDTWGNGSVSVTRARFGDTTQYRTGGASDPVALTGTGVVGPFLNATELVVDSRRQNGTRTVVTLTSTGTPTSDAVGVVPANATDVRNYQVEVTADTAGRILLVRASADYTLGGEASSMSVRFDLVRTDRPAVERPPWAAEALAG